MTIDDHGSGPSPSLSSNTALKGTVILGTLFCLAGAIAAYARQDRSSLLFLTAVMTGYCSAFVLYRNDRQRSSALLTYSITIIAAVGSATIGHSDATIILSVVPVVLFIAALSFSFRTVVVLTGITMIAVTGIPLLLPAGQELPPMGTTGIVLLNSILLSAAVIGRMFAGDVMRNSGTGRAERSDERPPAERGTILLVDDNETILDIMGKNLSAEGYKVLPFSSTVALSHWLSDPQEAFTLLITDYFLNESDGRVVIEQVRKILPAVPIILISGYPLNKLSFNSDYYRNVVFLQKPFSAQELIATVGRLIG